LLESIARKIEDHADELAMLESVDTGKAVAHAKLLDLPSTVDVFRYMGGWCTKLTGKTVPVSFDGREYHAYTRREPVGVVGAITPWNYPLALASWKIASALAAGCSVVIKPSEITPLSTLRLGELCLEAGLPEGVLNVVTGYGHEAGKALAEHPGVNKLTFTGSTGVAKALPLGNGRDANTMLGSLVSKKQQDRVLSYCESGVAQGAKLVTGGKRRGDKGYFVEPTVFANTNPSMKIFQQEIFGPVV